MCEISEERTYYIRTSLMYTDLTREVLFKVFQFLIKREDITDFLLSLEQQHILQELLQRHVINQSDYNRVSSNSNFLNLEEFDISLLVRLILNLCKDNIPQPQGGWETKPQPKDESLGADLLRLRDVRNKIIGHRADAKLPEAVYEKTWENIKAILLRVVELVDSKSSENFERRINEYKRLNIETENAKVKRLLDELLHYKTEVDHLQEKINAFFHITEFQEYFKITPEVFVRYIKLLFDGGRTVLCGIMKTKLGDQDLTDFLERKKETLIRNIDEKFSRCLYSQDSCSDYKNWDVFLLASVLLLAYDNDLSTKEIVYIEHIKSARVNCAALALQSLSDFLTSCTDLIICLKALSSNIAEDDRLKVEHLIEHYKKKDEGGYDAEEYFKQLRESGVEVKTLHDVYKETIKELRDMLVQLSQKGFKFEKGYVFEFNLLTICENEEIKKLAEDLLEINLQASIQKSYQPSGSIREETDKVVAGLVAHPDVKSVEASMQYLDQPSRISKLKYKCLTDYLKMFYSKSESFSTFCHEIEELEGFSLRIGPTFEKIYITSQDVKEINQNEALIEILQIPYTLVGIKRLEPILVVAKDTTTVANYIVSVWLNNVDNNNYPMNLNSLDGVFLLKIADSDDVSDMNIMMEERFEMKKAYYSQRILIIFECIHTDLIKLNKIYNLACSCMFQACKFIIITKFEKQVVLGLKLDIHFILIADKIDALHVARTQFEKRIEGQKLGKSIDQIVSNRKCVSWQKDAITKICFENIHPLNETATVRVPNDINNIEFHGCSHKIQVLHCAKRLDISVSNRFSNILPEHIVTPTLTTIAIHFKSLEHVFHKSVYESFAFNISRATHILSLHLCNMTFGRKSITVELQKEGIEQIRHSIESNEDYCRFGARILGPCLGKISFDKEDVESVNNSSFVKQIMLDLICYELVKSNRSVSECYPSQMECGTIKLICFVNDDVRIDFFKGFLLVKKYCNNISKESLFAENSCDREDNTVVNATVEEFEDINETLSFHAEALMASHRNLEAVKVSFVQPTDMTLVQSKLCIVLYCRAKGCIPYGDVRFPRTLIHPFKNKSFRTDVREGYFIACPYRTGHSTDFNKELAIGCSIGQYEQKPAATLGPFVNIKETNETCFLTVRHVFGLPSIKEDCLVGAKVIQPADYHLSPDEDKLQNRHCGDVVVSHIGGGGQIDAALVKISAERLPGRGQFIRLTREYLDWTGLTEQPMFNDGAFMDAKTLTVKDLATRRIIKIGCTTSLTKGTLSTTAGIVRETLEYTSLETLYNGSKEKYQIKSQLMVDSYYKKVFCQAGDSGSAVFLVEDDNHLNCIGMVIGFIYNDHTAIVTPIDNILQILGHKLKKTLELKKFQEKDEMDES